MKVYAPQHKYRHNAYWRTWNRSLGSNQHGIWEANLTPVNASFGQKEWDRQVASIKIRCHRTPPSYSDMFVDELPTEVLEQMLDHLSTDVVCKLLFADLTSDIDYDKYRAVCNGGAELERITA